MTREFTLTIDLDRLPNPDDPVLVRHWLSNHLLAISREVEQGAGHPGHTQSILREGMSGDRVGSWRYPPDGGDPPPPDDEDPFTHAVDLLLFNDESAYRDSLDLVDHFAGDENQRLRIADTLKAEVEAVAEWTSNTARVGWREGRPAVWEQVLSQFALDGIREVDWLDIADRLIRDYEEGC